MKISYHRNVYQLKHIRKLGKVKIGNISMFIKVQNTNFTKNTRPKQNDTTRNYWDFRRSPITSMYSFCRKAPKPSFIIKTKSIISRNRYSLVLFYLCTNGRNCSIDNPQRRARKSTNTFCG